jgi:uncharacterized membrane protein (DUF4010 family)
MTTEAAILLMYLVGAVVVLGDLPIAIAVGVGVAVLLQFKPEMHGLAAQLADADMRAVVTFALIAFVVLPVVPNQTYDLTPPLDCLNPFQLWLMVVLMVGISLGGYLIYKLFGRNAGIWMGGLLGGLISSTATTFSYSRRTRADSEIVPLATTVLLIASTVVYSRVLLEVFVVTHAHFAEIAPPLAIMMAVSILVSAVQFVRIRAAPGEMPEQKNPAELKSAFIFAGLYAGVLMALSAAQDWNGELGLYGIAILSGLTDLDAITLSTARLVELGPLNEGIHSSIGWRLIVVATMANLVFKWGICLVLGAKELAWRMAGLFAIPVSAGAFLLWLWPDEPPFVLAACLKIVAP